MGNRSVYIILSVFYLASCKKQEKLPVEQSGEPVFFVDCQIDGTHRRFEAGNDDYFMNTSWGKDSGNIYFFRGDLYQPSPANGRDYSIAIIINDYKVSPSGAAINPDSALRIGQHLYNDRNISGTNQTVSFKPLKDQESLATYNWTITDGLTDTRTSAGYSLTETFDVNKTYSVSLNYGDILGVCATSHTNVFRTGHNLQTTISSATTTPTIPDMIGYKFSYTIPSSGNYNCSWQFADGTSTSVVSPKHDFANGETSVVKLTLRNNVDTCVSYYQVNATNGAAACQANYSAVFQPVINTRLYSTVTVLLTDRDGVVYSSHDTIQPQSSSFSLMEVRDYKTNAAGEPTKQLHVRFNCVVKNGSRSITLNNGEALMGVAYKK
jgi:hypothetical protein